MGRGKGGEWREGGGERRGEGVERGGVGRDGERGMGEWGEG